MGGFPVELVLGVVYLDSGAGPLSLRPYGPLGGGQ